MSFFVKQEIVMKHIVKQKPYLFGAVLALALGSLLAFGIYRSYYSVTISRDELIADHIKMLADKFKAIDETVGILGFEHDKNYIDFLNVKSFVGSEVGSMNLRNPEKWQGPYLNDNPTFQEKYYMIVKTNKGYFIVPGDGVELGSGKIIGRDIIFTADTDIEALAHDPKGLSYKGRPLAAKITLYGQAQMAEAFKEVGI